jgi:uncharacterized protein
MIIETVVTTLDEVGERNFAAMGVVWGEETITIRPFTNTRTYRNLLRTGEAVVNVTDNVLIFAKSALSRETFEAFPATRVRGVVLQDSCHWREVRVRPSSGAPRVSIQGRAEVPTEVVGGGHLRPFSGLCRAKHAVVEASILASRLRFLPVADVLRELEGLSALVQKTGGAQEHAAMGFIRSYVARRTASANPAPGHTPQTSLASTVTSSHASSAQTERRPASSAQAERRPASSAQAERRQ